MCSSAEQPALAGDRERSPQRRRLRWPFGASRFIDPRVPQGSDRAGIAAEGDPDDYSPSGTTEGAAAGHGGRLPVPDPRNIGSRSRDAWLLRSWMLREVAGNGSAPIGFGESELQARGRVAGSSSTATAMLAAASEPRTVRARHPRLSHANHAEEIRINRMRVSGLSYTI